MTLFILTRYNLFLIIKIKFIGFWEIVQSTKIISVYAYTLSIKISILVFVKTKVNVEVLQNDVDF